uniref:SCAN box domain-containing protein n=1 Tax=Chelonoidis abingdonii TaxID=106734 RepID=A0A8C0H2Z7_CHEAB
RRHIAGGALPLAGPAAPVDLPQLKVEILARSGVTTVIRGQQFHEWKYWDSKAPRSQLFDLVHLAQKWLCPEIHGLKKIVKVILLGTSISCQFSMRNSAQLCPAPADEGAEIWRRGKNAENRADGDGRKSRRGWKRRPAAWGPHASSATGESPTGPQPLPMSVSAQPHCPLLPTGEIFQERNWMNLLPERKVSGNSKTSLPSRGPTLERNLINVLTVGRALVGDQTSFSIRGSTQARDLTSVPSVGKPSACARRLQDISEPTCRRSPINALISGAVRPWFSTRGATWERNPISALNAGVASCRARTSSNTRGSTPGRGPTSALPVGNASARAPHSLSTRGPTPESDPTIAPSAGNVSARAPHSSSTRGFTRGRSPTDALSVGRASAGAPT